MSHFLYDSIVFFFCFFFILTFSSHRFVLPLNWKTHNTRARPVSAPQSNRSCTSLGAFAQIFAFQSVLYAISYTLHPNYSSTMMSNIVVKCFLSMFLFRARARALFCRTLSYRQSVTVVSLFAIVSSRVFFFHFHSVIIYLQLKITDTKYTYYSLFWANRNLQREKNLNLSIGNENSHFFHQQNNIQCHDMARPQHRVNTFFSLSFVIWTLLSCDFSL